MNRRSLFRKLLGACAVVALAPQLAFRVEPRVVTFRRAANVSGIYEQLLACERIRDPQPLDLKELFDLCYELKRRREKDAAARNAFVEAFFHEA